MLKPSMLAAALFAFAGSARADVPQVVVDIPPVQGLVNAVMQGVGQAEALVPVGGSPHDFDLRPSDASRLSQADLVVWMGPALDPWLSDGITGLASGAETLALLDSDGWHALTLREIEDPDHGHGDVTIDPHAWLSPVVMGEWALVVAEKLAEIDPENAQLYQTNAMIFESEMNELRDEVHALLRSVSGRPLIVPHDAYQYLEVSLGLNVVGMIALSDATEPGPSHIAALRDLATRENVGCVLVDPQTNPDWAQLVAPDGVRMATVDPLATADYPVLIRAMATTIHDCLSH